METPTTLLQKKMSLPTIDPAMQLKILAISETLNKLSKLQSVQPKASDKKTSVLIPKVKPSKNQLNQLLDVKQKDTISPIPEPSIESLVSSSESEQKAPSKSSEEDTLFMSFARNAQKYVQSDTQSDDSKPVASTQNGFVPFQPQERPIQISQNEEQEGRKQRKTDSVSISTQIQQVTKKRRSRRSVGEVKETFRCFCGKNFVSYPGIYIHLKDKHLQEQKNEKFYLKTFKHKTTGEIVKQVVLENLKETNLSGKKQQTNPVEPIVLEIEDDDQTNVTEPKRAKKRGERKQNQSKDLTVLAFTEKVCQKHVDEKNSKANKNSESKETDEKYLKLTCKYQELLEKYISLRQEKQKEIAFKDKLIEELKKQLAERQATENQSQKQEIKKQFMDFNIPRKCEMIEVIDLQGDQNEKDKSLNGSDVSQKDSEGEIHVQLIEESEEIQVENNQENQEFKDDDDESAKMTAKFGFCNSSFELEGSTVGQDFVPLNEELEREMIQPYQSEEEDSPNEKISGRLNSSIEEGQIVFTD